MKEVLSWNGKVRSDGYIEHCNRPAMFITDKYIVNLLYAQGVPRETSLANPDLIEAQRQIIKVKRLLKTKKQTKCKTYKL